MSFSLLLCLYTETCTIKGSFFLLRMFVLFWFICVHALRMYCMVMAYFKVLYFSFYELSCLINQLRLDRHLEVPSKQSKATNRIGIFLDVRPILGGWDEQVLLSSIWYQYSAVSERLHHATITSIIKPNYFLLCCNFNEFCIFYYNIDNIFSSRDQCKWSSE